LETLTGSIERITYYNPENGYTVARLRPDRRRAAIPAHGVNREGLLTIVGNLPELTPGEYLKLKGDYANHPKHGFQFQVEICEQSLPATIDGIRRYLGSGLVKGIGPKMADRIVEEFGEETLAVIEEQPERLREVPDIGPKRAGWIAAAWHEQKQIKDIMLFLHGHGITTNMAIKIYKTYGEAALQTVRTDPYQLARDIYGIGFKTADKIAQNLGLAPDHPSRIEAGLVYTLNRFTDDGHVFALRDELVSEAAGLLALPAEQVSPGIERLAAIDHVKLDDLPGPGAGAGAAIAGVDATSAGAVAENPAVYTAGQAVYLSPLYYGEVGVSRRTAVMVRTLPSRLADIPPAFLELPETLSQLQREAIRTALSHPVSILTGGPGTGKTTALRALIDIVETHGKRFALVSPTGRAAKRLSEATGRPASTIHRLLDYSPIRGFTHDDENPLQIDLMVVDETSMLDLILANSLFKALEPGTHLLLVGDVDQLPSVGAGDVLRDLIASGVAPVTRLDTIFRQAADSFIIANAHRINEGTFPEFPPPVDGGTEALPADFFLFPAEDGATAGDWVVEVATKRIPERFGFDPLTEIQVLAPMYRGPAGVRTLNERIQDVLNPGAALKPEKTLFGQVYRPGDRVMQTQNDYDKDVFNGDIGRVVSIDALDHTMTLEFDGREVEYGWTECDQITLAYCISVHKSQGAEYPVVVLPMVTAHYMMLQRNLLYTAVTRAKKLCVLIGSRKAIGIAISNNQVARRNTALDRRLQEEQARSYRT